MTRPAHHSRALPEALHPVALDLAKAHVGRQLGCQPAHLAPAHGIRLPRHGEGGCPRLADAPAQQVGVDNGVGLVHPLIGLVDPLTKEGDCPGGAGKQLVEAEQIPWRQIATSGYRLQLPGWVVQCRSQLGKAAHMAHHVILVPAIVIEQIAAEAIPQRHITAGLEGQMQIPLLRRHGATGIQHHQLEFGPPRPSLLQAAKQHRVGPGGVGPRDHHQIRELQILVAGGYQILAEGALMSHHRR